MTDGEEEEGLAISGIAPMSGNGDSGGDALFVKPKLRQHRSPQTRAPRPAGFAVGGSDPAFPVVDDSTDDSMDNDFRRFQHGVFRYHSAQKRINYSSEDVAGNGIGMTGNGTGVSRENLLPPPSYHEVVQQRSTTSINESENGAVISKHNIRSRRHVSPDNLTPTRQNLQLKSRRARVANSQPSADGAIYSSEGSSPRPNCHNKENLNVDKGIPFIDDTPSHQRARFHGASPVRMRQPKVSRSKVMMREHRNSYITAVNASKSREQQF